MLKMSKLIVPQHFIPLSCIVTIIVATTALFVCYLSFRLFELEMLVLRPTPLVQLKVVVELLACIKVSICYLWCLPS
jgi:hypothetical protein